MRTKSAARKEYIVFMNNDTLLYWHKLENFYPYILEEQHNENRYYFLKLGIGFVLKMR